MGWASKDLHTCLLLPPPLDLCNRRRRRAGCHSYQAGLSFCPQSGPSFLDPSKCHCFSAGLSALQGKCGLCSSETFLSKFWLLVGTSRGAPCEDPVPAAEGQGPPLSPGLRLRGVAQNLLACMSCCVGGGKGTLGSFSFFIFKNCLC